MVAELEPAEQVAHRGSAPVSGSGARPSMRLGGAVVRQRTLKQSISCKGVGLHSGRQVRMSLHPAEAGTGIVFHRTDVSDQDAIVPALWDRVVDTVLCTRIANEAGVSVGTVEHLMAALAGAAIDNLRIEIDGPEVPIMDGSSEPFLFLIACAGVVEQQAVRNAIRVLRPISVVDEDDETGRGVWLEPADGFDLALTIDFPGTAIGRQSYAMELVGNRFSEELGRARTFGFVEDVERLQAAGLARGGSIDNAVVVDGMNVLNPTGLRYQDEFVRHKLLDCVGDLYLAGAPLYARVTGFGSGHRLNNLVLRALFAASDSWTLEPMAQGGLGFALPARSAAATA